jgi:cell division protein FtsB
MISERSFRRLPLRDLMTDAEKRTRDLIEHFTATWLARVADLRDLSRPIRKRSHYPTLHALQNALNKVVQTNEETRQLIDQLTQEASEILEHARREQIARR